VGEGGTPTGQAAGCPAVRPVRGPAVVTPRDHRGRPAGRIVACGAAGSPGTVGRGRAL